MVINIIVQKYGACVNDLYTWDGNYYVWCICNITSTSHLNLVCMPIIIYIYIYIYTLCAIPIFLLIYIPHSICLSSLPSVYNESSLRVFQAHYNYLTAYYCSLCVNVPVNYQVTGKWIPVIHVPIFFV